MQKKEVPSGTSFAVEKVETSTFSDIFQGQLAPMARPAALAEKALLCKRFADLAYMPPDPN